VYGLLRWIKDIRKIMKLYLNDNVSKLLGHSSMKVTQDSYGKIVEKKISEEMSRLMCDKRKNHSIS
jgi:hypothetical protein